MKKLLILVAAVAVIAMGADLNAAQKNYGCGLGALIWGPNADGLISQTFAGTTNMSTYTQFFGITSGTSECESFKGIASNEKIENFVADNMDSLASDISKGNGEYLNTLAVLMEVSENERGNFYKKLQNNFTNIYTSDQITHKEVINNIAKVTVSG